jgi:hypothetical protein
MSEHILHDIVFSSKHKVQLRDSPIADIDADSDFIEIFNLCRPYSMTSKEAMYCLYCSVKNIIDNNIPGDFVECGVWRGGSSLLAAMTFRKFNDVRSFWMYDTYEGMSAPTYRDVDISGGLAKDYIEAYGDDGRWCYADLNDVITTFNNFDLCGPEYKFIKGDVEKTLASESPDKISILRLDTDWYESTKIELNALYPKIAVGGMLIVDDYGYWKGSRMAVDEYFCDKYKPLLMRVNSEVRLAVKVRDV